MRPTFNHELFQQDVDATKQFFIDFAKSFGPSTKKVMGREIGFFEEMKIRFMFNLIDIGPVKLFRATVVIIFMLIMYFTAFQNANVFFKIITIVITLAFSVWVFLPEFNKK